MDPRAGLPLGRVFGVPVRLAPSWFLVAGIIVVLFAPSVGHATGLTAPLTWAVAAAYALLLLASVLVHEFAHAAVARARDMPVTEIVATLWGGHTQFEDEGRSPMDTALVAIAGPVSNAVLAVLGWMALDSVPAGVPHLLVLATVLTNGFVAAFNLAPGLPLDGGRVVEALIWAVTSDRATGIWVAGWCGRVVAAGLLAWVIGVPVLSGAEPNLTSLVWAVMIAAVLWQGASSSIGAARLRRSASRLRLADFVEPAVAAGTENTSWWQDGTHRPVHLVAVDPASGPVGVLYATDRRALLDAVVPPPPGTPLSAVMTVLDPVVLLPARATGEDVLSALARHPAHVYLVLGDDGAVTGLARGAALADAVTGGAGRFAPRA